MAERGDRGEAGSGVAEAIRDASPGALDVDFAAEFEAAFVSEAAFRVFYDRALPRVYGYLYYRCRGDRALSEDLTQASFSEAIHRRRSFDGRSEPVSWIIGIARHKLLDHLRAEMRDERRRLRLVVRELAADADAATWQRADDREALSAALATLPAAQRLVLILHYADGLPVRDVARELGRSEAATESLMARARVALRAALGEAEDA